jgi:stearoyl-CoA desaturase (delta-9 desaturase)
MRRSDLLARIMAPSFPQMRILQLISGVGLAYAVVWSHAGLGWWLLSLGAYFLTGCLGLSVTMHRSLTHRSIKLPRPLEILFTFFGVAGGSGSPIAWTAMHRAHHAHVDTSSDPHFPEKLGWRLVFSVYQYDFNPRHVRDLMRDRLQVFIHRYYPVILLAWAALLTAINPRLCLFVFLIPAFVQVTVSNLANLVAHGQGERRFETPDHSTNNVLISIMGWGEGWHNNHHHDAQNWNFSRRWWELDPGAIAIVVLKTLGLARIMDPSEVANL